MVRHALKALLIVLCSTSLYAQVGPTASEPKRPAYNDLRFDEDWSVLRGAGPSGPSDVWDRVKFIPLTDGEDVWLTFAGQVREREEYVHQFQFGESQPEQSDAYLLSRIRLSADLHASRTSVSLPKQRARSRRAAICRAATAPPSSTRSICRTASQML
jgi:hypothetical protein